MTMIISQVGRELIERNEGRRLAAYQDSVGVWTIGYGDTGPDVVEGLRISPEEADQRLSNRLAHEFGAAVNADIGDAPTTQGQFDAMVSLAYNIGTGGVRHRDEEHHLRGFAGSSVLTHHLAGEYAAAADAFMMWDKAGGRVLSGLERRRGEERDLYLSTVPAMPGEPVPPAAGSPPTPPAGPIGRMMSVTEIQTALVALGYDRVAVDGVLGDITMSAIADFQATVGLLDDGIAGPKTQAALAIAVTQKAKL